jgi:hypothetical protein
MGRLHQIVSDSAAVFSAEHVGECERFGELFGLNKEASAIRVPDIRHQQTPNIRFQSFKVSEFQGFKVSRFQSFKVSEFQSFKVSKFQAGHLLRPPETTAGVSFEVIVNLRAEE